MVELTMRLLVGPVILLATLSQALGGINRGLRNNGRLPLSREEELTKALQFLEEYERNLEGKWVPENQYEDLGARDFMLDMDRVGDEDIVPGADQDDTIQPDNAGQFMNFLQAILQGVNKKNRDDVVPQEYLNPQRSALNNQYVLFSPLDADLEDEIALEETIVKLKTKERKEKLWEEILGDMLAEDILETEAKERIKELMDVEEEEEELVREDLIFAEEDPWSDTDDSFEAINDDDDVVPWSWASPDEDEFDEDTSSFVDEFDSTESLTSEDQRDIEGEAAVILLKDILANQEKTQKQEEEEEENEDILEMLTAEDETDLDDEDLTEEIYDSATENAFLENYFKQLLENHDKSEETLEEVSEESDNIEDYSSQAPEELEDANDEVIQDYGDESDLETEDQTEEIYDSAVEDALNNYFKEMLENHDRNEETLEGVSEENENIDDYSSQAPDELEDPGNEVIQDYEDYDEDDEAEYHMLLREITNEIEAAAQEVEEEVAAALKDQLENNSQNNLLYLNEEDTGQIEEHDPSIENNELDASQIWPARLLENYAYGKPRAADITTEYQERSHHFALQEGSDTCPVYRWLVNDCAFINSFPDVDASGIYRTIFQNACNRHQLCYTCGQSYDIESTLCNDVFDAEMIATCGQNRECIDTAEQFVFIASNTYTRQSESPSLCEAKCLVDFLVRD